MRAFEQACVSNVKCGSWVFQLTAARPRELSAMSKRHKTVSRTYGGTICHKCVRSRSVQALGAVVQMVIVFFKDIMRGNVAVDPMLPLTQ